MKACKVGNPTEIAVTAGTLHPHFTLKRDAPSPCRARGNKSHHQRQSEWKAVGPCKPWENPDKNWLQAKEGKKIQLKEQHRKEHFCKSPITVFLSLKDTVFATSSKDLVVLSKQSF